MRKDPSQAEVIAAFLDLAEGDRLEVFEQLRVYLAAELGVESDLDREIRRRREALAALERVAAELRKAGELAEGAAPTAKQFDRVAREIDLGWSTSGVIRAFGAWRSAKRALLGDEVADGPMRVRARRRMMSRQRSHEDPLAALREWLDGDPVATGPSDYDAFSDERNRRQSSGSPLPKADAITSGLRLSWDQAVAVAKGETSLAAAQQLRSDQLLGDLHDDDLIGMGSIALFLDLRVQEARSFMAKEGSPCYAAKISGARAWLVKDIRAHREGRPVTRRKADWMQEQVVDGAELAAKLKIQPDYLRTLISKERWDRVPKPDGRVGNAHYWWRTQVQAVAE